MCEIKLHHIVINQTPYMKADLTNGANSAQEAALIGGQRLWDGSLGPRNYGALRVLQKSTSKVMMSTAVWSLKLCKTNSKTRCAESFRVLVKKLQSVGLDMRVLVKMTMVNLRDLDEGEDDDVIHVDDLKKREKGSSSKAALRLKEKNKNSHYWK